MTKEDIVNKQFSRAFLGYDVQEVDGFLDEIIREIESLERELDVSQMRAKLLAEELLKRSGRKRKTEAAEQAGEAPHEEKGKEKAKSAEPADAHEDNAAPEDAPPTDEKE